MKKIIEYALINSHDYSIVRAQENLVNNVTLAMYNGWQPLGGVVYSPPISAKDAVYFYTQTMVRYYED